jgi:uncharacterized protein YggE
MRLFVLLSFLSFSAFATDDTVQVQGKCEVKVSPDRGMIVFTVENQSKDQAEAVQKTTAQMEAFKSELKALKFKDSELHNGVYEVAKVQDYVKDRMVDRGFRATMGLELTTSEVQRLGQATQLASKHKITNVGSLSTFLSLEKSREEYLKCLDIAAEDARKKAQQLAKKLGFTVGSVQTILENPISSPSFPAAHRFQTMAKGMDAAPSMDASQLTFSTQLSVSFYIK